MIRSFKFLCNSKQVENQSLIAYTGFNPLGFVLRGVCCVKEIQLTVIEITNVKKSKWKTITTTPIPT